MWLECVNLSVLICSHTNVCLLLLISLPVTQTAGEAATLLLAAQWSFSSLTLVHIGEFAPRTGTAFEFHFLANSFQLAFPMRLWVLYSVLSFGLCHNGHFCSTETTRFPGLLQGVSLFSIKTTPSRAYSSFVPGKPRFSLNLGKQLQCVGWSATHRFPES